jgi:hypothetical protein
MEVEMSKVFESDYIIVAGHKGDKGTFKEKALSEFIKWRTYDRRLNTQFSHTELIFPNWVLTDEKNCFSSRGMDKPNGVSFKKINFSHADRWETIVLGKMTKGEIRAAYDFACAMQGQGYDFRGVVSYWGVFKRRNDDPDKWWCSEACAIVAKFRPYHLSPNELMFEASRRAGVTDLIRGK